VKYTLDKSKNLGLGDLLRKLIDSFGKLEEGNLVKQVKKRLADEISIHVLKLNNSLDFINDNEKDLFELKLIKCAQILAAIESWKIQDLIKKLSSNQIRRKKLELKLDETKQKKIQSIASLDRALYPSQEFFYAKYNIEYYENIELLLFDYLDKLTLQKSDSDSLKKNGSQNRQRHAKNKKKKSEEPKFPRINNLAWNEVSITITSSNYIRFKARDITKRYKYLEIDIFVNSITEEPSRLFERFKMLPQLKKTDDPPQINNEWNVLKKSISDLRIFLKDFFYIKEDPIRISHRRIKYDFILDIKIDRKEFIAEDPIRSDIDDLYSEETNR
jgi:hypothetical protein